MKVEAFQNSISGAHLTKIFSGPNVTVETLDTQACLRKQRSSYLIGTAGLLRSGPNRYPGLYRESFGKIGDKLPDAGEDGLLVACERPVIGTIEFDESRMGDVAREMPPGADANGAVAVTVEH